MGEPVTLHKPGGETVTVYTRSQAASFLASGEWYATAADAKERHAREGLTPATAAKLDALEEGAGAAIVTENVTEAAAPVPPAPEPDTRTVVKKTAARKGGL